jgi:hypothetical protein
VFLAKILASEQDYFRYEEIVYEYSCDNPGQLTKNRKAISDLQFAIKDMLEIISYPKAGIRVAPNFLSREILTLLKHGAPKLKLRSIGSAAKGFKLGGQEFFMVLVNEMLASLVEYFKFRRNH